MGAGGAVPKGGPPAAANPDAGAAAGLPKGAAGAPPKPLPPVLPNPAGGGGEAKPVAPKAGGDALTGGAPKPNGVAGAAATADSKPPPDPEPT